MNRLHLHPRSRSRGATLVVVLIFLILMGLFAVMAFNTTNVNLRVIGNTQARQEGMAAAKMALEETISTSKFHDNPAGVAQSPVPVDIDGDGRADYEARLDEPYCYGSNPTVLPPAPKADPASDPYRSCRGGSGTGSSVFVEGGAGGADPSGCADTEWNVRATISDAATHTTLAQNQGVAVTVLGYQVAENCK